MSELNDLLRRYLEEGDAGAMEEIVKQTRARLLATARRIGNPQDAEDSVQATYHALLRRGDRPLDAPLIAWLMTVVVRIAFRRKAIQRREAQIAKQLALPSDEVGPRRAAEILERNANLREEVGRLAPRYRDALILRYLEGLSVRECARLMDVPEETVRTRLKRARRLLRGRLHPRVAGMLLFVPWWLADSARASSLTLSGVAMKSKIAVVAVLIAVAGLLFVSRDLFRGDGSTEIARTDSTRRGAQDPKPDAAPDESAREKPAGDGIILPDPVDLDAVDRDRDVHGTVVRLDGSPVAGARLRLVNYPWRRGSLLHVEERNTEVEGPMTLSARDGTFRIAWQRAQMGWLNVVAEGCAARQIPWVQAGERLRVVVSQGVILDIRARDAQGKPVAGASVHFFHSPRREPGALQAREHMGETDERGRCELTGLNGPSKGYLELKHPQLGSAEWKRTELPEGNARLDVEVSFREHRTLTGRITDKQTGAPIAGARVGMNWVQDNSVRSADDGSYTLPGWTGHGVQNLHVSHPDYGRAQERVGSRELVDFELQTADRVSGRVVDVEGRGLGGVRIAAIGSVHDGQEQWTSRCYGTSQADGQFALTGLSHEMFHAVIFLHPGFGRMLYDVQPSAVRGATIEMGDVVLHPGLSIEGRVLDGAGKPLTRVAVDLTGANADRNRYEPRMGNRNLDYGEEDERVTDDLGRFRFPDLAPGSYEIVVDRGGGVRVTRTVELAESSVDGIELAFELTRPITVRVVDPEDKPVADAFVNAMCGLRGIRGHTDDAGKATLLATGPVTELGVAFVAGLPEGTAYRMPDPIARLADDRNEVEFVLKRAATITGVVLKPDGTPLPKAVVTLQIDGKNGSSAYSNEKGRFSVVVAPGARVDLVFAGMANTGGVIAQVKWTGVLRGVSAGARDQELRLTPVEGGQTVTVLLLDPDGAPVEGRKLYAIPRTPDSKVAVTDAAGRATLTNLLKVKTSIMVYFVEDPDPETIAPKSVSIVPAGQEITMRYRRAVLHRGKVIGADDALAIHLVLYRLVDGKQQYISMVRAAKDGTFALPVPADEGDGPFLLMASGTGKDKKNLAGRLDGVRLDGTEIRIEVKPFG